MNCHEYFEIMYREHYWSEWHSSLRIGTDYLEAAKLHADRLQQRGVAEVRINHVEFVWGWKRP